ncbi:hypothetical protein E2C01_019175 [Portunus trituberculatus]|uniref:Uncharacterized protein n=1 Tax=Portunus trituberculatus TaxID=210409 RepID=A0A5B7DYH1_PORTR|nr:hypothetical protein [Portunus trituberculatus]
MVSVGSGRRPRIGSNPTMYRLETVLCRALKAKTLKKKSTGYDWLHSAVDAVRLLGVDDLGLTDLPHIDYVVHSPWDIASSTSGCPSLPSVTFTSLPLFVNGVTVSHSTRCCHTLGFRAKIGLTPLLGKLHLTRPPLQSLPAPTFLFPKSRLLPGNEPKRNNFM